MATRISCIVPDSNDPDRRIEPDGFPPNNLLSLPECS
jgi:hypothetical protein